MDDLHTSLSEDTCTSLDDIVVHESEDYFLVEITTHRVRALIDARDGFLERLLALTPPSPLDPPAALRRPTRSRADVTSEMTTLERTSYVEACAMEVPSTLARNAFHVRPTTNTWHPETSSREVSTNEFARATRHTERAQQLLEERLRQKS